MLFGFFHLPWWGYILVTLILTHITVMSVTLYLHRSQAHRAMDLHPALAHFFRFWLWLTTSMITQDWIAIHRKHHATCETEDDPHSPQILGIKKVFWEGAELYRAARADRASIERFGHGAPNDWLERNIYSPFASFGPALMFFIDIVCFGIPGISIWAVQMMWIPLLAAGVINGIGHYWGYRNFECKDASRNVIPIGLLAGGEELHNNHHAYGSSAKFSVKWWEIDLGWGYICIFKALGLVKIKKTIPVLHLSPVKSKIDVDTIKAFIHNRVQILSDYCKEVIVPAVKEEQTRVRLKHKQLLTKINKALIRDESLIDSHNQRRLRRVLKRNPQLNVVYNLKQQLQMIWTKTTANQKELIDALQEWCHQAEATGIESLKRFADKIRQFSMAPVHS